MRESSTRTPWKNWSAASCGTRRKRHGEPTKRATDALILARTGELPPTTALTSRGLLELAGEFPEVEGLVGRYYTRIGHLHGSCFYNGMCDPVEETQRRIRETIDYIRDAERLASP